MSARMVQIFCRCQKQILRPSGPGAGIVRNTQKMTSFSKRAGLKKWSFLRPDIKNREKGVLVKGVAVESSVTAKETKVPKDIGPSTTLALKTPQPREAYTFAKPPL